MNKLEAAASSAYGVGLFCPLLDLFHSAISSGDLESDHSIGVTLASVTALSKAALQGH